MVNIIPIPDDDFVDQKILSYEETCTFVDDCIEALKSAETFPASTILEPLFEGSSWISFRSPEPVFLNIPLP